MKHFLDNNESYFFHFTYINIQPINIKIIIEHKIENILNFNDTS